jgi:glycosyltransferase involved in cell wall biosynthesis
VTSTDLLFVSGEYPPDIGGVADYTQHLQQALAAEGQGSRALTRRHVRRWDARSLAGLLRRAPRDGIVHIQYQPAAYDLLGDICLFPTLLHWLRPRVKVVTTFHDARVPYLFPKAGRLREKAVRLLASTSDVVIAADEQDLLTLGGPSRRHWRVPIGANVMCAPPVGYDRDRFRGTQLRVAPESPVVAYFGLLNASKGMDLLFDAFDRFAAHRPAAHLLLLGGGVGASDPSNASVAARVERRLSGRVTRTGWLEPPQLSAHLLASDVALLPYADGASGRRGSLLACAAHALPIVSTTPTTNDVATAVLATSPAPDKLAQAVARVLGEPALAASLRAGARDLATRHSWPAIAQAHLKIYAGLRDA